MQNPKPRPLMDVAAIYLNGLKQMSREQLAKLLSGDPREALVWVRAAAMQGIPEAQIRLGRMLLAGDGVGQDRKEAFRWFKRAAQTGDADAFNMLGRCHEHGWGTPMNPEAAFRNYYRAAKAGHDWGQYNLGHCYLDGLGVCREAGLAIDWYRKAAGQGHERAMNLVGRCYEEGWGVVRDAQTAGEWYRKSAQGGYFRGQYNWASFLLSQGQPEAAAPWFLFAARNGSQNVKRGVANVLLASGQNCLEALVLTVLGYCCEDGEAGDFYLYGRALLESGQPFSAGPAVYWLRKARAAGYPFGVDELELCAGGQHVPDAV